MCFTCEDGDGGKGLQRGQGAHGPEPLFQVTDTALESQSND